MGIQHSLAAWMANAIEGKKQNNSEKILLIYGIEVFLNEALKILFFLVVGGVFGILWECVIMIVYILLLRKFWEGKHFENNIICTLVSMFTVVLSPFLTVYIKLNLKSQMVIVLANVVYDRYLRMKRQEKIQNGRFGIYIYIIGSILPLLIGLSNLGSACILSGSLVNLLRRQKG